ncbi:MAG: T9SS type A sorting domain-containing protein [Ignavibacteriae bacterium]|nr:T9SS type A sorting domain-containing protein [Ignavibacteriota bacterium]
MNKLLLLVLVGVILSSASFGQIKLQEGFEAADSANLPAGWSKWNLAPFPIDPAGHWFVADTGTTVAGIAEPRRSVARNSLKAAHVTWYAGVDTTNNNLGRADAWLVTKRIRNIDANDSVVFWAIGGNGGTAGTYYYDTLDLWMDTQDSLPANIAFHLGMVTWNNSNSVYGVFKRYAYPLGVAAGNDLFIAFRYLTDVSIDGFVVYLDDVMVKGPLTSVSQTSTLPHAMSLSQNYPNPFNPNTTIEWSVPSESRVTLTIYNMIGQEVNTLVNHTMDAGTYRTTWDASDFPTGMYFYRLQIGDKSETRKMVYLR